MRAGTGHGAAFFLGDLEADIMESLWRRNPQSAKDLQHELSQRKPLAVTTILTILSRLKTKGLIAREKTARAFTFSPTLSREEFLRREVRRLVLATQSEFPDDFARVCAEIN